MRHHSEFSLNCKVYVANVAVIAPREDLEFFFNKFGGVKNFWMPDNPSDGYAYIEYGNPHDASHAVEQGNNKYDEFFITLLGNVTILTILLNHHLQVVLCPKAHCENGLS